MKEALGLLNEGKYNEALIELKKIYSVTDNPMALYYITFIEYYYLNSSDVETIRNNFKILYNHDKITRIKIYDFYLSFLMDNNEFKIGLKIAHKSLKETKESFINCYAYSRCLCKLNKDLDLALIYAKKSIEVEELNEQQKLFAYSNLIEIYCLKEDYNLAKETINKLYLFSSDVSYISLLELQVAMDERNDEDLPSLAKECLKFEQNKYETIKSLAQYYYESEQYNEAIHYLEQLKEFLESPSFANEKIAISYLYMEEYDKGIEVLANNPLDNKYDNNYILAKLYYYKEGKENLKKSLNYVKEILDISENKIKTLNFLGDIYIELTDLPNLKKIIDELHKKSKHGYVDFLEATYYRLTQQFDKAEKLIKTMIKQNIPEYKINTIIESCSSKPEVINNFQSEVFNKSDKYSIREKADILMYGEYGFQISMEQAYKHIEELKGINNLHACEYYTIATYHLLIEEKEQAYKYAQEGYDMYLNNKDHCHCCASLIAYLKYKENDIEEAYKICKYLEEKEHSDLNENAMHIYAQCSIVLNKDLNKIYDLLEKTLYRRYSPSRYFMIIKVGKLLNKDINKYIKLFKQSLKHCSQREANYYSKEQEDFLLNNF